MGLHASHTADVFLDDVRVPGSCLLGGKERLEERLAAAREGRQSRGQAALRTFEVSRPTVGAQAIGNRPRGVRVRVGVREAAGCSSAGRSRRTRRSRSPWPT